LPADLNGHNTCSEAGGIGQVEKRFVQYICAVSIWRSSFIHWRRAAELLSISIYKINMGETVEKTYSFDVIEMPRDHQSLGILSIGGRGGRLGG
jgi:hypothetical protein